MHAFLSIELIKTSSISKEYGIGEVLQEGISRCIYYNCLGITRKNNKFLKIYENLIALIIQLTKM